MNIVDLLIVLIVALYMLRGWARGFLAVSLDLASLVFAFLGALRFYPLAATWVQDLTGLSTAIARAAGFLLVFTVVSIVFSVLASAVYRSVPHSVHRSCLNRALGLFPAALDGLLIATFLLVVVATLPVATPLSGPVGTSRLAEPLLDAASIVEARLRPVFDEAITQTLSFLTIKPESEQRIDLPFKVADPQPDPQAEEAMLEMVNRERVSRGLSALEMDETLRQVARAHSADMFRRGYFGHVTPDGVSPFDRMREAGISFMTAGENLALARSVQIAHNGLMNSPGHRANILNPSFGKVGIGILDGGIYGLMVSQEFTN